MIRAYLDKKNWTLRNVYYVLQSFLRRFYTKKTVTRIADKAAKCPECWENGACLECGCEVFEMFKSDKSCPNEKF